MWLLLFDNEFLERLGYLSYIDNNRDDARKEDNLSPGIEKYRSKTKNKRKHHNEMSLKCVVYALLCHTMVEVRQIAFHRVLPRSDTPDNNIESVYKINTQNYGCCRYFTTCHDSQCGNHKAQKHTSCIPNDTGAAHIKTPENKQCRKKNSQKRKHKTRIVLRCECRISEIEFHGKTRQDNTCHESHTRSHSPTIITPVNRIHHEHIPNYRGEKGY